MKAQAILILLMLAVTALLACGNDSGDALNVAKNFWTAMEERDIEKARTFATRETAGSVTINEDAEEQEPEITFGDVTFEDGAAMVATTIAATGDDAQIDVEMQTVLVKEDGVWKVHVDRTFMSMFGGAMGEMMNQMGEAMQKGMEEMGKAMVDAMEEATKDDDR